MHRRWTARLDRSGVNAGIEEAASLRGCRVVTTSMTARLLLGNQLRSLREISWTVVSGDALDDPPADVSVVVVPMHREFALGDIVAVLRLLRLFRRERFDFVQTHTPKASFLGLPAARLGPSPAVYTVHGAQYFHGNGRFANVLGWIFEKWCCSWADVVLVQSREDQSVLPRVRICPARKIRYIGNGVMLDRFLAPVEATQRSPRPTVLMVSRLVREKGCLDFIEAARTLGDQAEFVHVGPTESDQHDAISEDQIAAAADVVSFMGPADDVRPYLASADVVVLPSYREGIPRVPMEAAAMGRPVVAYDVRGVREVVGDSTGCLVPRGDVEALIEAVADLVRDPDRRLALGRHARARASEAYSEDAVITRLRSIYGELSGRAEP